MVTVYRPYFEPGYDWAMPVGDVQSVLDLKSRRRGDPWQPLWMYMITTDAEGRSRRRADMPWHGSNTMVLKEKARQVLESVLGEDAELLQAYDAEGEDLWLVHAWNVVDALDEEGSEVQHFKSGKIMEVRRWSLRAGAVEGLKCFRVPQQLQMMLVTDKVVTAVNAARLRGTTFRPVWRS
jgi:hypothetical protein